MIAVLDLFGRLVLLEPLWLLGLLLLVPLAFGRPPSVRFSPAPMAVSLPRSLRSRLVRLPRVLAILGFACQS